MPIIENNCMHKSVSETASKPVAVFRGMLEFLTGCEGVRDGCFVDKQNGYTLKDLLVLSDIIREVNASGMIFNELIIGPVDFFSATNTRHLLLNPIFQLIFKRYKPVFTVSTTFISDDDRINLIIDTINKHYPENMEVELSITFEHKKFYSRDIEYIQWLKNKIKLLDNLKQPVRYAFQLNNQHIDGELADIVKFVRDEFNAVIDIA